MPLALTALLARTKAQFAAETDPAKRVALSQDIAAFERTMKKSEEDDDEEDDDEDEKKSKKSKKASAAKKAEEAAAAKKEEEEAAAAKGNETERKEKKESEEEAALSEIARVAISMTGATSGDALRGKLKAVLEKAEAHDDLALRVEAIEKQSRTEKKAALISGALHHAGGPRITRSDAKWLESQSLATVESYLESHTKAIVNVPGAELTEKKTDDGKPDTSEEGLTKGELAAIDFAMSQAVAQGLPMKREAFVAAHNARKANGGLPPGTRSMNGKGV